MNPRTLAFSCTPIKIIARLSIFFSAKEIPAFMFALIPKILPMIIPEIMAQATDPKRICEEINFAINEIKNTSASPGMILFNFIILFN